MFLFNTILDKQLWRKLVKVHFYSNANAYLKMKVGISTLTEAVDIGCNNDKSSHLFTYLTRGDVVCPLRTLIMIHLPRDLMHTGSSPHVPMKGYLIQASDVLGAISKITFSIHVSKWILFLFIPQNIFNSMQRYFYQKARHVNGLMIP